MRSFHRILGSLFVLCLLATCGKTSQTTKLDVGVPDTSGTKADVPVGEALDAGRGQTDVGPSASDVDGAGALPDAGGADADAWKPWPDVPTDLGEAEVGLVKPDGAVDSPPSLDGSRADGPADGRVLDGGTGDDEIVRLCALAASCGYYAPVTSPSQCVQEFAKTASRGSDLLISHLRGCANARGCSEFGACWGGELFSLDRIVWNGGCEGDSVRLSASGRPVYFDCSKVGASCVQPATSAISATCNARPCYGEDRAVPSCADTVLTTCGGWAEFITIDCARIGLTCSVDDRQAECVGSGAVCDPSSDKVTCSGSVATYCAGGALATIDCAKNAFATRCASGAPSTEPCAAAGPECDPSTYVGGCDNVGMQMCVNGYVVSVDCHALGLVSCTVPATRSYASCRQGV